MFLNFTGPHDGAMCRACADEELELSADGQAIRRRNKYLGKGSGEGQGHGLRLLQQTLEMGADRTFQAVRVPADIGYSPYSPLQW